MNEKYYPGESLGQIGGQMVNQVQLKQADIFDQFRQAKIDYDNACREFSRAQCQRAEMEKRLAELSQKTAQVIQCALQDPTVPQCTEMPAQTNGRW